MVDIMYQWVVNLTFGVVKFSSFLNDTVWIFFIVFFIAKDIYFRLQGFGFGISFIQTLLSHSHYMGLLSQGFLKE